MFSFVPSASRTAVFFARIVIPFSRSRSIESRTRSATSSLSRNEPACQRRASTSVVLPWSTCATIATLRMSSRRAMNGHGSGAGAGLEDGGLAEQVLDLGEEIRVGAHAVVGPQLEQP